MSKPAYYNENDPFAAAWLDLLIRDGHVALGYVDRRSIVEVQPDDLKEFGQCHFFAGIGGWSRALRLAGVPDDEPIWTGSCPCQPFSQAGKGKGDKDARHLWPEFARLIRGCNPATVFGEQVASKAGREWLAGVFADLEGMGYRRAGADLCAASTGAPHIRQRLWWVADSMRSVRWPLDVARQNGRDGKDFRRQETHCFTGTRSEVHGMAESKEQQLDGSRDARRGRGEPTDSRGLGDSNDTGSQGRRIDAGQHADQQSPWAASVFIPCTDNKLRRVPANEAGEPEPALFPLATGVSNRVGTLRGSGNAIVPEVAAIFIEESLAACAL